MSVTWPSFSDGKIHQIKHRKKWQPHQTLKYFQFIILNKLVLEQADRNKKHQVYNRMSLCVGSRSTHQCRSHHQKIMKRFGSIDEFCKIYQAKNRQRLEHPVKAEFMHQVPFNSKKPDQEKNIAPIKQQELSSRNLDSSGSSNSDKNSSSKKQEEDQKCFKLNELKEKIGKQYFLKNSQSGTKLSEASFADQKTKSIKKLRLSTKSIGLDQEKDKWFSEPGKQNQAKLSPIPDMTFQTPHLYVYPNSYMNGWNEMMQGQFPPPIINFNEELRELTERYLGRIPAHEGLKIVDDGISYLMMRKNLIAHSIQQRIDPRKKMGTFGPCIGQKRGFIPNEDLWAMVAQTNKEQLPTGVSMQEVMRERMRHGINKGDEEMMISGVKLPASGYQIQNGYDYIQSELPISGINYMFGRGPQSQNRQN